MFCDVLNACKIPKIFIPEIKRDGAGTYSPKYGQIYFFLGDCPL